MSAFHWLIIHYKNCIFMKNNNHVINKDTLKTFRLKYGKIFQRQTYKIWKIKWKYLVFFEARQVDLKFLQN
jgi:hypothetical protein